ncbi:phage holin family protein [Hyphococcus luteus]|uniref:Uncharacterized protein n=1 Tax=Hyphococcus luteus TaxID=2058213 RepID=A0A2S7KA59_9PROT|nr:hypothetical protein [Marinicaulis flavus]PQA89361.1 hypothetical protein CW354_00340 [Marinicaulis flavus]
MFKLFQVIKEEGEDAVRKTIWTMFAAFLLVIAVGFAAAASAVALSNYVPMSVALAISAGGVVVVGLVCLIVAERDHYHTPAEPQASTPPATLNLLNSGLVDQATQQLLLEKVKSKPAGVLAIAAAAGLAVAALDAFDDD